MTSKRGGTQPNLPYRTVGSNASKKTLLACEANAMYIDKNKYVQPESAMHPITAPLRFSEFRANLFQVADAALASGEPVPLERNGHRLWLVPESAAGSRLNKLPKRNVINGNADDLANLNAAEWNENNNLG